MSSRGLAGTAASAIVLLAVLGSSLAPEVHAAVADTTATETVDKLRSTVTRLAAVEAVAPAGWKAMAEQTLTLGQELLQAKQPLAPGLVLDALAAVDQGEASDPRAADWPKLREDLRRLLEPPPQQQKQDDQKQDNPQQQDNKNQQQQSGEQDQPKDEKSEQQKQDQQQEQSQQQQQQQAQKQDSALGDLQKPQDQQPQPQPANPPQPQTRKFGGKQDAEQKQSSDNPELAAARARLEQVQENDSPARLHQRIEEEARRQERQGPAPANPHDW